MDGDGNDITITSDDDLIVIDADSTSKSDNKSVRKRSLDVKKTKLLERLRELPQTNGRHAVWKRFKTDMTAKK
jgi:hypothetical protein